jgi:DNA-binding transcriptional MerR regulator
VEALRARASTREEEEKVRHPRDRHTAARTLRDQGMPDREIREVLSSGDSVLVRRHLELHGERLQERLQQQRQTLASLEQLLIDAIEERPSA